MALVDVQLGGRPNAVVGTFDDLELAGRKETIQVRLVVVRRQQDVRLARLDGNRALRGIRDDREVQFVDVGLVGQEVVFVPHQMHVHAALEFLELERTGSDRIRSVLRVVGTLIVVLGVIGRLVPAMASTKGR